MKLASGILLAVLAAGCSPNNDNKPIVEQQREALNKAKKVDGLQQQEAQKQQQEADKLSQ